MASPTRWIWVWVNSGSCWWTGRPDMLQFMGSQRVGHDWVTELNWPELVICIIHSTVYMQIPVSQSIPRFFLPWYPYICSLHLCLCFCFANKFIYIIFPHSMNIEEWIKVNVVHMYNGILSSHKKERHCVIWRDVNGSRDYHTEWSQKDKKKYLILTHLCESCFWIKKNLCSQQKGMVGGWGE